MGTYSSTSVVEWVYSSIKVLLDAYKLGAGWIGVMSDGQDGLCVHCTSSLGMVLALGRRGMVSWEISFWGMAGRWWCLGRCMIWWWAVIVGEGRFYSEGGISKSGLCGGWVVLMASYLRGDQPYPKTNMPSLSYPLKLPAPCVAQLACQTQPQSDPHYYASQLHSCIVEVFSLDCITNVT